MKTLTLGNYRHTVTIIRSLARAGYSPIVGRDEKRTFTQFSRYTSEIWDHPKVENEYAFVAALKDFLENRPDIRFVFPIGETFLECIARNLSSLPSRVRYVMPDPKAVSTCLDKAGIYKFVVAAGIPVPASGHGSDLLELKEAAATVGYPCIVKPNRSFNFFFNQKAIICSDIEELRGQFPEWPAGNDCLVVQQYIRGYRPNCHFAAVDGRLISYFEHNVIRTDRLDETGFEVDGVSVRPTPHLREYCDKLIRQLNYTGVGCVQFLTDSITGRSYFLEINPRLDATCALPYYCGFDFPRMAIQILERSPKSLAALIKNSGTYPAGRRAYWLMGDILGLIHGLEDKTVSPRTAMQWLKQSMRSFFAANVHLTFSVTDPKPTGFLYFKLLKSLLRRVWRRYQADERGLKASTTSSPKHCC
ncbi:MAG: ATP-grasp domain-containing protein [Acidobacteria bacterium]|nr:ATP-grasp domain-containing protein [Acidobacteriota bacterium]